MADELQRARERRQRRQATRPAGTFEPSARRQIAISRLISRVDQAEERRDPAAYYAGKTPAPERITMALDFCGLYGPEVDQALGGEEPMVDEWESGERVPSLQQIQALAGLTGYAVRFFYLPPPPPLANGWICGKGGCAPLGGKGADANA